MKTDPYHGSDGQLNALGYEMLRQGQAWTGSPEHVAVEASQPTTHKPAND